MKGMVTRQMHKSEVMNRNASLSSELCAKSSKGTVCNEVFRFTGNSTSSDHKNFRQRRNSATACKRNKKKICRKTPNLDNKMRKMVIKTNAKIGGYEQKRFFVICAE